MHITWPRANWPRRALIAAVALAVAVTTLAVACDNNEPAATTPAATPAANGIVPTPIGEGDPADEALSEIDHLVHEWEDGDLTAEEALERIDAVIHDLPGEAMTDTLRAIDDLVHDWEDGDLTAEEALERIDELLHD